jgi:NAD(P)-dependent dehydrogenase (short-subunit alcohol dehydrogenase family)
MAPERDARSRPVAVVTGASRGIGAAVASGLTAAGYDLLLTYATRREAAEAVAADCRRRGARVHLFAGDLGQPNTPAELFEELDRSFGGLALLVNNAGYLPPPAPVAAIDTDRATRTFAVNAVAPLQCAREAIRRMLPHQSGVIINVSSRASVRGAAGEFVDYAMSKAAVDALTIGLAAEVAGQGIRVNGVRPGLIDTEMNWRPEQPDRLARLMSTVPLGRAGTAVEVAGAICWLASEHSSYITGVTLDVSGGR